MRSIRVVNKLVRIIGDWRKKAEKVANKVLFVFCQKDIQTKSSAKLLIKMESDQPTPLTNSSGSQTPEAVPENINGDKFKEGDNGQPVGNESNNNKKGTTPKPKGEASGSPGNCLEKPFSVSFMNEKKKQNGEDSEPLLFQGKNISAIGVFDGMGGAGSTLHMYNGTEKTGAYIGSRCARDATESFFRKIDCVSNEDIAKNDFANDIKEAIKHTFNLLKTNYPPKVKTGLKSSMIKEFPTTLAIVAIRWENDEFIVDSFWAGDSRNFLLTRDGLFQLSVDDLEGCADPYENLSSDSPLSNQISADKDFVINHISYRPQDSNFMAFSATDGCFGYYPTPMHFEYNILRTLSEANSFSEWNNALKNEFDSVASDDISMAGLIYGYTDFDSFKKAISPRYDALKKVIDEYECHLKEIEMAKSKVADAESGLKSFKQDAWDSYKQSYMSITNQKESND